MNLDTDWKTNVVKINTITIITLNNIIRSIVINNAYDPSYKLLIIISNRATPYSYTTTTSLRRNYFVESPFQKKV